MKISNLIILAIVASCILSSCGLNTKSVNLEFILSESVDNETSISFYLDKIRLTAENGEQYRLVPKQLESTHPSLVLIHLNHETQKSFRVQTRVSTALAAKSISFELSIPQDLNHANPLIAQPPLNESHMFWSWQQGYKYLRIDAEAPGRLWALHLGSTHCQSPSPLSPPETACARANILKVQLDAKFDDVLTIVVDTAALKGLLSAGEEARCTGNYTANSTCIKMLEALGIDAHTGECQNECKGQKLFNVSS